MFGIPGFQCPRSQASPTGPCTSGRLVGFHAALAHTSRRRLGQTHGFDATAAPTQLAIKHLGGEKFSLVAPLSTAWRGLVAVLDEQHRFFGAGAALHWPAAAEITPQTGPLRGVPCFGQHAVKLAPQ